MELMDFSLARLNHRVWKMRLRAFLDGREEIDEKEAVSHRDCDLGKWLYGFGLKEFGDISEMQRLEKIHADLHNAVKRVVKLKNSGNNSVAEDEYKKLVPISNEIIELLNSVEHQVQ